METITYRMARRQKFEVLNIWTSGLAGTIFLVNIVIESFRSGGLTEAWSQDPLSMWLYAIIVLSSLVAVVLYVFVAPRTRGRFVFQLDEEGLTYGRRQWRWDELSTFKLHGSPVNRHIVFTVPGKVDEPTRFNLVDLGLPEGPLVRIGGVWDAPLDEIAATLNAYRDKV